MFIATNRHAQCVWKGGGTTYISCKQIIQAVVLTCDHLGNGTIFRNPI